MALNHKAVMCKTVSENHLSVFLLSRNNWPLIASAAVIPTAAQERELPAAGVEAKQSVTAAGLFVMGQGCCQDWNHRYCFPCGNLSVLITELLSSNTCDTISTRHRLRLWLLFGEQR